MLFRLLLIGGIIVAAQAAEPPPERAAVDGLAMTATRAGPSTINVIFEITQDGPDMMRLPLEPKDLTLTAHDMHFFSLYSLDTWTRFNGQGLGPPTGRIMSQRDFIKIEKGVPVSLKINIVDGAVDAQSVLRFSSVETVVQVRYGIEHASRDNPSAFGRGHTNGISRERVPDMWEGVLVCLVIEEAP